MFEISRCFGTLCPEKVVGFPCLQLLNVGGIGHEGLARRFASWEDGAGPIATEVQVDHQHVVIWALGIGIPAPSTPKRSQMGLNHCQSHHEINLFPD